MIFYHNIYNHSGIVLYIVIRNLIKKGMAFFVLLICASSKAQLIDNFSTFRNIDKESYFRFHYDNDFFTNSDIYYSQGITLEYVHPALKKSFLTKLLLTPKSIETKTGITFNLFGYTPTTIKSNSILYGDRPYASAMSLKIFSIGIDSQRKQRLHSALQAGIIGPLAQGENIQTGIHRWLDNPLPKGWQHQIKNDIILNYQLNYEKRIVTIGKGLLINAATEARIGTLHNRVSGGINFMTGHFSNPYQTEKRRKVNYYLYGQSRLNFIGYDALMQGGLFNRKSVYTITSSDISRVTFQADAGIIVNFPKLYLSYTQSFLTKEFRTGRYHRWGGFSVGFSL